MILRMAREKGIVASERGTVNMLPVLQCGRSARSCILHPQPQLHLASSYVSNCQPATATTTVTKNYFATNKKATSRSGASNCMDPVG